MAGTPPLMAQAPTALRILQSARNPRSTCTFSALHTPPSTSPISHGSQRLMSVNGERLNSTCSSKATSRSSISRKDIWQPKQPASDVVAILILGSFIVMPYFGQDYLLQANFTDLMQVKSAPSDRHFIAMFLDQDRAYRTNVYRHLVRFHID